MKAANLKAILLFILFNGIAFPHTKGNSESDKKAKRI